MLLTISKYKNKYLFEALEIFIHIEWSHFSEQKISNEELMLEVPMKRVFWQEKAKSFWPVICFS